MSKKLHVIIDCLAYYENEIDIPDDMNIDEAIEYAKEHLSDIPLGELEYVSDSDSLDEENCFLYEDLKENCDFDEELDEENCDFDE